MNPQDDPALQDPLVCELAQLQRRHWPASIPLEPVYPFGEIALGDYLRRWTLQQPDKPAVIFYGTTVSYAQLDLWSDRCAALLARHGVQRGDRVAVMLGNCPQFHIVFFAILKLGAVHVPVNPLFKEQEMLYELNDSSATVLVVLDQLADMTHRVLPKTSVGTTFFTSYHDMLPLQPTLPVPPAILVPRQVPSGMHDLMPLLDDTTLVPPLVVPDLDAPAALNYTGGTTGMPKGCVHTQRDMIYTAATTCSVANDIGPDEIALNYMSLFWIAGENAGMIFPIFTGSTVVLLARWDPVGAMAAIEHYAVTRASMVVDNAVEIMDHPQVGDYDLNSLKAIRVSSFVKKLNPGYRERWFALTGTVMAEAAWGMTETHTCDTFTTGQQTDNLDLRGQPVFVGLPVPGTVIKICSFDTGATLPVAQEGEIVVRSPSLLKAYWNKPESTAESLCDGWFRTGDIGVFDDRGCLHFLGRAKEMLKVKGMSVFPAEVEALLGQHPDVLGSGVVGQADADKGEAPIAFVRMREGSALSEVALAFWCRDNMASYKVPQIRFVDELPMTATGKVKKHELQALLTVQHDQPKRPVETADRNEELARRRAQALGMGGAAKLQRTRERGALNARERIARLIDPGSFFELGLLTHSDVPGMEARTPADGKIVGIGRIDRRLVLVKADDVTVLAGAGGRIGSQKSKNAVQLAVDKGYPIVNLGEAGGARLPDIQGSDGLSSMTVGTTLSKRRRQVPMVAAILGECFGSPSWHAAFADFVVQLKGSCMAVSGPRVLEIATGEKVDNEELGGWKLHATVTGLVDRAADTEDECLALIREFLGFLPSHAQQLPPRAEPEAPGSVAERQGKLMTLVPEPSRRAYDMHAVVRTIVDDQHLFELKPLFDRSVITTLARIDGHPVGIIATNPMFSAGAMGPDGCAKCTSFIVLCDSFNIPLVFLHDTPGFFVGKSAEQRGMPGKIINFIEALSQATVPKVAVVVRKSYGMAYGNLAGAGMGADFVFAWAGADISFMSRDVAVNVISPLDEHASPESKALAAVRRDQLREELHTTSAPWRAAGLGYLDDVIRPDQTRQVLIDALDMARGVRSHGMSEHALAGWPTSF